MTVKPTSILFILFILLFPALALAHQETGLSGGLISGFLHPIYGVDHLVAMVAVGIWGAQLGNPSLWVLPICFPLVMALGGAMGVIGLELPAIEVGVALSAVVLGLMVIFVVRPPVWAAGILVGIFAVFHGHAHGTELPAAANPISYALGFVSATGLLHLAGILIGCINRWAAGAVALRCSGGLILLTGFYYLLPHFIGS